MSEIIGTIFYTITNEIGIPLYYGLVGFIAIAAIIVLLVRLIQVLFSSRGMEQSAAIKSALIVIVICLVAGFVPDIINWVSDLTGGTIPSVDVSGGMDSINLENTSD